MTPGPLRTLRALLCVFSARYAHRSHDPRFNIDLHCDRCLDELEADRNVCANCAALQRDREHPDGVMLDVETMLCPSCDPY